MGRRYLIPWKSDAELVALLELEREALALQVAAVKAGDENGADLHHATVLLVRYLVLGSGKKVAMWANARGWRLPGAPARGKRPAYGPREYAAGDIHKLVNDPPSGVPPALVDLARHVLSSHWL